MDLWSQKISIYWADPEFFSIGVSNATLDLFIAWRKNNQKWYVMFAEHTSRVSHRDFVALS